MLLEKWAYEVGYLGAALVAHYLVMVPPVAFVGPGGNRQRPWSPATCLLRLALVPRGSVAFVLGMVGMGFALRKWGHG